jgi:hypothetical protein
MGNPALDFHECGWSQSKRSLVGRDREVEESGRSQCLEQAGLGTRGKEDVACPIGRVWKEV